MYVTCHKIRSITASTHGEALEQPQHSEYDRNIFVLLVTFIYLGVETLVGFERRVKIIERQKKKSNETPNFPSKRGDGLSIAHEPNKCQKVEASHPVMPYFKAKRAVYAT